MAAGIKTGGRQKGTPNKLTREIRSVLKDVIHAELEQLPYHLEKLEPNDRLQVLIKLMPFALPKIEPVKATSGEPISWDVEFEQ